MKEKMKDYLKEIVPALILAFVVSFMLFICESITSFSSNTEDFWFNLKILLSNNILFMIISIVLLLVLSNIVLLFSKITKKKIIYGIFILLFNVAFISTYIQGNYLAGGLPTLDGSPIDWNNYTFQSIISCVLIVIVLIINVVLFIKFKKKYMKIISYVASAIFVMLSVSLISVLVGNPQIYQTKGAYTVTNKDINKLSTNKNFLMLLVDMEDAKTFEKVLKDENKEELFKDFTYYPDTLSAYPFTRESIPYILSGIWFEEKTSFADYYNLAMNESKFIKKLMQEDYDVNIYEQELCWNDSKSLEMNNILEITAKADSIKYFKQEAKYILFKYLPFPLKKYSKIETLNYNSCRIENDEDERIFQSDNKLTYDVLDDIKLQKDNYFQFVHVDGGHYPWDMNKNFEKVENGTYEEKIGSSITLIEKYLDRIKKSGQYDNSVIIVLADHGNNGYDAVGRQNPILYIKGINETHNKTQISDKKVSYVDLNDCIYYNLMDGKQGEDVLPEIDDNRVRRFIWYKDYDDMYEQTLDGHAWETDKLINTGNTYKK